MQTIQYTIRNIPEPIDRYLRKLARQSGKSLNQVVIEELSENVAPQTDRADTALAWFIGSGIDNDTLSALQAEDIEQKVLAQKELE